MPEAKTADALADAGTILAEVRRIAASAGHVSPSTLEPLAVTGSAGDHKTFWKAASPDEALFVKVSSQKLQTGAVDRYLTAKGVAVPAYVGDGAIHGAWIYVWRMAPGVGLRRFRPEDFRSASGVARTVAKIELATTDAAAALPTLFVGVRWVEPLAELLEPHRAALETADLGRALDIFLEREKAAADWLESLPCEVLVHNDVKAPNCLVAPDRTVTLVDWDSASIGPHGASLRVFTRPRSRSENEALAVYVRTMTAGGTPVDPETTRLTMRCQEIFWALNTGSRKGSLRRLAAGVRMAAATFDAFS